MNKVFQNGRELTPAEIAQAANAITRNKPFMAYDFDERNPQCRVSGPGHCQCGGNGEFELLPASHSDVQEGKKRYMRCRKCGCYSHL